MTRAALALALALLLLGIAYPAEAGCHVFRIWHYSAPQRCPIARAPAHRPAPLALAMRQASPLAVIPSLEDAARLAAIAKLRDELARSK